MRENRTYGSVRGGQSNLIPSTRLKRFRGFKGEGIALWAMSRKSAVMGFTFVSPVLHDEEPEPPSLGRGWRRQATEDRSVD